MAVNGMEKGLTVSYPAVFPQGFILKTAVRPQSHKDADNMLNLLIKAFHQNNGSPISAVIDAAFDFAAPVSLRLCGKYFFLGYTEKGQLAAR